MQHRSFLLFTLSSGLFSGALAFGGCAEDLRGDVMAQPDLGGTSGSGKVKLTKESSDVSRIEVNGTAMEQWVYLRLDTGAEVTVSDPAGSREWDVGVRRYFIKINGGTSGGCGSELSVQSGADFAGLARAPMGGYVTDQADSSDEDMEPDYALSQGGGWYDYNVMTHALTPKAQIYALKTCTGGYVKLQMTGYYDSAGTSGFPSFRVAPVAAP